MKTLVTGPWIGEFGWELMSWQGYLRTFKNKFDNIYVCAPAGHEMLYCDFATHFIPHDLQGTQICCDLRDSDARKANELDEQLRGISGERLSPRRLIPMNVQKFIRYGDASKTPREEVFDVLIHFRSRPHAPERNYNMEFTEKLVETLRRENLSLAVIGSTNASYCPKNVSDLRDRPLEKLCNIIAASRVVVDPSSGPMHLASLCHTPHVVWGDKEYSKIIRGATKDRYERIWNPLETRCVVLDEFDWQPPPERVFSAVLERLRRHKC